MNDVEGRVLYTTEEAAVRLGIGITKAKEMIADGSIPSIKIGRLRRILATALDAMVETRYIEQTLRGDK